MLPRSPSSCTERCVPFRPKASSTDPTEEDEERALLLGAERSIRLGWTAVHIPGNSLKEVELLRKPYDSGKMKLRIYNAVLGPGADTSERKVPNPRWRVEHAQIVHPDDIPRFARLGAIPSMQPSHAIGDLHFAPSRLGLDRLTGAYAWKSFIQSGSIVPGGSDAPVGRGEPMIDSYAAVARSGDPESAMHDDRDQRRHRI